MAGQVEEETKQARKDELVALFQEASAAWAEARVGSELRVMVDRMDGLDAVGRTEHDAPDIDGAVRIPAMPLPPGSEAHSAAAAAPAPAPAALAARRSHPSLRRRRCRTL